MQSETIIALIYDFDKTLTTKDMQDFTFIPSLKLTSSEFWQESNGVAKHEKMDRVLAYMHHMISEATHKKKPITRGAFEELGKGLEYFPGVHDWFKRINEYCAGMGVIAEHYVISSGLRETIVGSEIYDNFKEVFACEFFYDVNNVAVWPKNVVNYTTKTQYVFRINKGLPDLSDDDALNAYTPENSRRIPFRNMIYVGDGPTDVPCMRLVKSRGGYSIAVYTDKSRVRELIAHDRVNFIAPADYSQDGELDILVKDILIKISTEDKLAYITKKQRMEIGTQTNLL